MNHSSKAKEDKDDKLVHLKDFFRGVIRATKAPLLSKQQFNSGQAIDFQYTLCLAIDLYDPKSFESQYPTL